RCTRSGASLGRRRPGCRPTSPASPARRPGRSGPPPPAHRHTTSRAASRPRAAPRRVGPHPCRAAYGLPPSLESGQRGSDVVVLLVVGGGQGLRDRQFGGLGRVLVDVDFLLSGDG